MYFGEHFGFPRQTLAEQIVSAFASRRRTLQTIERKVACYITLLSLNSTRILNDFEQMIRESGRRLEVETREMLNELRSTVRDTLSRAEETRAAGTEAVTSRLQVLEELRQRLVAIPEQSRALSASSDCE